MAAADHADLAKGPSGPLARRGDEPARMRRRLRPILVGLAVLVVLFCAATARLMIWPTQGMPGRVGAIVMLSGPGDRMQAAVRLAREHRAPVLVVSRGH